MSDEVCIQYLSDIHLEIVSSAKREAVITTCMRPAPGARVLVLAGDIGSDANGSLQAALTFASRNWEHVVYVMGNHEYYKCREESSRAKPRPFETVEEAVGGFVRTLPNVHWLSHADPLWVMPDARVAFVGCTLWSNLKSWRGATSSCIQDFRMSCTTPEQTTQRWERDKKVLSRAIAQALDQVPTPKIVVVTHHLPSVSLISPRYLKDSEANLAFASSCEWLMTGVEVWIYGHTHEAGTADVDGCVCVVNPVGYPDEDGGGSHFHHHAVVWV
jgi:predicted phosphodiesterase